MRMRFQMVVVSVFEAMTEELFLIVHKITGIYLCVKCLLYKLDKEMYGDCQFLRICLVTI